MDAKYAEDKIELEWGNITQEDILRRMYKHKTIGEMNEQEIDRMLEDLI